MMIHKKRLALAAGAIAVAATMALSGCTGTSTAQSKGGPTLTTYLGGSGSFIENFNPFTPTALGDTHGMIYEPLFFFNNLAPATAKPTPLLGKSYSWNSAGTVLTVALRDGVKWSDGKPFTASDVAYTFNLVKSTPAFNTSGNAPAASVVDTDHVKLTFTKPSFTDGPTNLGQTWIVPEHIWKSKTNITKDTNQNPVGTGPMMVSSFTPQSYLLKKNPNFWDASDVQVGGIRVLSLSGNQAATDKFLAGQIDWANFFIPNIRKVLGTGGKGHLQYVLYSNGAQEELATCSNTALGCTGPQTDPVVRNAISAALDRDQVNKLAYYGTSGPITSTFAIAGSGDPFIAPQFKGTEPLSPDIAKADGLLESDGWKKGADGIYAKSGQRLSIPVIVVSGYTDYISALAAITQQLKAAGIEITTQQIALNDMNSKLGLGKFQMTISAMFPGVTSDPYYIYSNTFASGNTAAVGMTGNPYGNIARYSNPTVDQQLKIAAGTEDIGTKKKAYATIQQQIVPNLPYIPVLTEKGNAEMNTTKVTGFPSANNLYANPGANSAPGNEIVLMHLKVK